jgi:hypothetical protein
VFVIIDVVGVVVDVEEDGEVSIEEARSLPQS